MLSLINLTHDNVNFDRIFEKPSQLISDNDFDITTIIPQKTSEGHFPI